MLDKDDSRDDVKLVEFNSAILKLSWLEVKHKHTVQYEWHEYLWDRTLQGEKPSIDKKKHKT